MFAVCMRYAIFSDIHSNLEAFEAVCSYYRSQHIDRFICLGDIIGYGANPNECFSLLKQLPVLCIAGNHEWGVLARLPLNWFNSYARDGVLWTRQHLESGWLEQISHFDLTYTEKDFVCVHASLEQPHNFHYIFSCDEAESCFSLLKKKLCFIGHSHRAGFFYENKGRLTYGQQEELRLEADSRYIVNVGSVGQPRDRDPRACCCIYDSDKQVVNFKRLEYNIAQASEKIQNAGLPVILAQRLFKGW